MVKVGPATTPYCTPSYGASLFSSVLCLVLLSISQRIHTILIGSCEEINKDSAVVL